MSAVLRPRATELSWREVDGAVVLLDERDWQYLQLRGTAALLWPLIEAGATTAQLSDALIDEFSIDRSTADADVELFVADLLARDLISPSA